MNDHKNHDEVCELCEGTGEIAVEGQVWAGEPHVALLDVKKCECTLEY